MIDSQLKKLPVKFQTFSDLDIIHRIADRLFIEHQTACMSGNWEKALYAMERMYEFRMQNIQDEEDFLLPLYQSGIGEIPRGGALKFFVREHKLIKKNLDQMIRNMSNIILNDSGNDVNLIKLFEGYHTFKDLLDHHDSRERVFLYKLLDERMEMGVRDPALQKINIRWTELREKIGWPV